MDAIAGEETPRHLKRVSRIKHVILSKYLPAWGTILGSIHRRLAYIDCYAGPGAYEFQGKVVDGSPLIAMKAGREYIAAHKGKELSLAFVEKDNDTRSQLEKRLSAHNPLPKGLRVFVLAEDARDFVSNLLSSVSNLVPSFFMVDPYGHPLSIPILNSVLRRKHTEALINFMFWRINMDIANPKEHDRVDKMFGTTDWRNQPFLNKHGQEREEEFLSYFCQQIEAKYKLTFKIRFDQEDNVPQNRTKYYLIHASNHPKALLLMKEVMWPLGDEEGLYQYSGTLQQSLLPNTPQEEELRNSLLQEFAGKEMSFDGIREATWKWPFIEKHYRSVIKALEGDGLVRITRISSKKMGLKEEDRIHFLPAPNIR